MTVLKMIRDLELMGLTELMDIERQYRAQSIFYESEKNKAQYYERYYKDKADEVFEAIKKAYQTAI